MRRTYIILIIAAVIFGLIGYMLGKWDNGPQHFKPIDTTTIPSRLDE